MRNFRNLIYISGSGRSGSTLLERVLQSSPGVRALGELHCLWRLQPEAITCSCGSQFPADEFWNEVLRTGDLDHAAMSELAALEATVCRTNFISAKRFSLDALRDDPAVQRFLELQFALFEAIATVGGSPVLVDSSKAGPRAWLLACDPRVRIVHLFREPADVLASWRKQKFDPGMGRPMKQMPLSAAAADWLKVEMLVRRLGRARPVTWVGYGELCAEPKREIGRILESLAVDAPVDVHWIGSDTVQECADYHSINGNPDRFSRGPIMISKRELDWKGLAPVERLRVKAVSSALRMLCPPRN